VKAARNNMKSKDSKKSSTVAAAIERKSLDTRLVQKTHACESQLKKNAIISFLLIKLRTKTKKKVKKVMSLTSVTIQEESVTQL
jgi:hypothetical protein